MKKTALIVFSTIAVNILMGTSQALAQKQLIAGAGPSTKVVQLFVEKFVSNPVASKYEFTVPPRSAKHAGGIKASSKFIFGRTGRPLNAKEKNMNKSEIVLARIPIAFATGKSAGISDVDLKQLEQLFTGQIKSWSNIGGDSADVILAGREKGEALFSVLINDYPFFNTAKFNKVFKKDHQVVSFLKSPQGKDAIAFGALPNFKDVNVIQVNGFSAGVSVGLVYDNANKDHELVQAAISFSASDEWKNAVKQIGLLTPQ